MRSSHMFWLLVLVIVGAFCYGIFNDDSKDESLPSEITVGVTR